MAIIYTLLQDPPKFTQFGIFGLKIKHLAILILTAVHTLNARGDGSGRVRIDGARSLGR
jgi:hypothetical protein